MGRYRLTEQIGRSDVAAIYRAYEVTGGGLVKPVTLLRMLPEHARRLECDAVLVEGARIAEQLDHPNLVKILDLDRVDGVWFSAEERVEGRDLDTLITKARERGQKIDHHAALYVAIQVLQGLAHVHERTSPDGQPLRILHRDVCPKNVVIGYGGEVRLRGFGYAHIAGRADPGRPGLDKPRYRYVSPEQAMGSALDHRSDLFSVGLLLWELIAGRPAYESADEMEALSKARRATVPPLHTVVPELSPDVLAVLEKAVAFNRDQRHASAQVFRDELARVLHAREPTYGPAQLASQIARVLADEAAEDRRQDAAARAALLGRSAPPTQPQIPSFPPVNADPVPPARPVTPDPTPSPAPAPEALPGFVSTSAPAPPPEPAPAPAPAYDAPPPPVSPEPLPASSPGITPRDPTVMSPPLADLGDKGPPLGKIAIGVAVLGLVGIGVFALSSESNMRLVKRKAREAVVGRKPGGQLSIESMPAGALVIFDDEPTGKRTPMTIDNVESEVTHHVQLELEGEKPITATVSIPAAGAQRSLNLVFKDAIVDVEVRTEPPTCEVYKDGRNIALTPTKMLARAGETFKLEVKKLGYEDFVQEITVERGKPINLDITMKKTDELLAAEEAEAEAMRAASGDKRRRRRRRR